jgi:hypothetical protein
MAPMSPLPPKTTKGTQTTPKAPLRADLSLSGVFRSGSTVLTCDCGNKKISEPIEGVFFCDVCLDRKNGTATQESTRRMTFVLRDTTVKILKAEIDYYMTQRRHARARGDWTIAEVFLRKADQSCYALRHAYDHDADHENKSVR